MPVDPRLFDEHSDKLKKIYGEDVIRKGSEYTKVHAIPTGSHEIDWAMYGGFPIGRRTRLYGGESTSKTGIIWNVIRNAQNIHIIYQNRYDLLIHRAKEAGERGVAKELAEELKEFLSHFPNGMECAYYNIEKQYHRDFVKSKGVDVDRLHLVEGTVVEQVGAICEALLASVHFHAIDSTSTAIALRRLNSDAEDEHRALEATAWTNMFARIENRFDSEENTLAYISHSYETQGARPTEIPKGGKRMGYSSDMTLQMRRGGWLYRDKNGMLTDKDQAIDTISGLKEPDGIEIVVRVAKSRVSPPFRTARARLGFHDMGFDRLYEISEAAKHFGFASTGSWISILDENGDKTDTKFHGEFKFREWIRQNPDFQEAVLDALNQSEDSRVDEVDAGELADLDDEVDKD